MNRWTRLPAQLVARATTPDDDHDPEPTEPAPPPTRRQLEAEALLDRAFGPPDWRPHA